MPMNVLIEMIACLIDEKALENKMKKRRFELKSERKLFPGLPRIWEFLVGFFGKSWLRAQDKRALKHLKKESQNIRKIMV